MKPQVFKQLRRMAEDIDKIAARLNELIENEQDEYESLPDTVQAAETGCEIFDEICALENAHVALKDSSEYLYGIIYSE